MDLRLRTLTVGIAELVQKIWDTARELKEDSEL